MLTSKGTAVTGIANPTNWETAYAAILKLRGKLSAEKVPAMDRVLLINAAFEEFLLSDGSKLTNFDKSNMTDGLREATIGRLLGFDVVTSPWLDNTKPVAVAFHKPSVAYVSQVEKTESMRAEQTFADRVRGLHVYGGAVLRPKVKGENGLKFELADEVATAMITAGILEETTSDEASPSSEDVSADEGDAAEETSKKSKK